MSVEHVIIALVIILVLSLCAQPLSRWLHLPFASVLVLVGYLVSELIVRAGFDTGLRADNFQSIIFYVFIPVLVFESAYKIDKVVLRKNLPVILSLAVIAMLLTCVISAILLYYGIGHATGFPWIAALITGSILAATDPTAALSRLREMDAPGRLSVLLEGESLFNDATAIVLFSMFLAMATSIQAGTMDLPSVSILDVLLQFGFLFFGGMIIGLVTGLICGWLQKKLKQKKLVAVMSLIVAYGSYLLAELAQVSGVMATLLAALFYSLSTEETDGRSDENSFLWGVFAHIAEVCVFLIMGAVITIEMFEQRWLAMLIAIAALLFARAISVYGVLFFFSFAETQKVLAGEQAVMVWSGLRGAVTLALALSLPTTLDYWWTIQSIAFGVVMFSLFVQAPTIQIVAGRMMSDR